jgi:hypothetical protein
MALLVLVMIYALKNGRNLKKIIYLTFSCFLFEFKFTETNFAKIRGIPQNYKDLRNTEFLINPRNFRYFGTAYGMYGSEKKVRNSVLTEFRKHPIFKRNVFAVGNKK